MALKKTEIKKLDALIKKLIGCGEIKYSQKHIGFPTIQYLARCANIEGEFISNIPDFEIYSVDIPDFFSRHIKARA